MKSKITVATFICILSTLLFQVIASANASWHWTSTSSLSILPVCIILTLLIETFSFVRINEIKDVKKVFAIVCFANLLSFVATAIFISTGNYHKQALLASYRDVSLNYIVIIKYLILTLVIEIPVVVLLLKNSATSKIKLLITVLCANIVTTLLVVIIERIVCLWQL